MVEGFVGGSDHEHTALTPGRVDGVVCVCKIHGRLVVTKEMFARRYMFLDQRKSLVSFFLEVASTYNAIRG
jgi:hypothetical protein